MKKFFLQSWSSSVVAIVLLVVIFSITTSAFLSQYNLFNLSRTAAVYAFIAGAQLMVAVIGGMNLAVGAVGALSSVVLGLAVQDLGLSTPVAIIVAGTMDQSNEVMNAIANDEIDYTVAQNGWAMGYVSSMILCMLQDGWEANEFGEFIDTGYIFIDKENSDSWQTDIEQKAADLIGTLETDWFKQK